MTLWVKVALALAAATAAPVAADPSASWALEVSERLELAPGAVATVSVALSGRNRYQVARRGPLLIDISPSGRGISVRQRRYQRGDADAADAAAPSFSIPVRAEAAGSYQVEIRARFWVCTASLCQPVDQRRAVAVEVRQPVRAGDD